MSKVCRPQPPFRSAAVAFIAIAVAAAWALDVRSESQPLSETRINRAHFGQDRDVQLPVGFRLWEHVGTRIKADGFSVLDGSKITIPQVMDAYVEPSAYRAFKKTGKWPDGTQIIKEYSLVKTGQDCNATTFVCSTVFGRGVFEERYSGLGMMIKDRELFPATSGYWGYLSFLPTGGTYQSSAGARPRSQCSYCHERGAAETDYDFQRVTLDCSPAICSERDGIVF